MKKSNYYRTKHKFEITIEKFCGVLCGLFLFTAIKIPNSYADTIEDLKNSIEEKGTSKNFKDLPADIDIGFEKALATHKMEATSIELQNDFDTKWHILKDALAALNEDRLPNEKFFLLSASPAGVISDWKLLRYCEPGSELIQLSNVAGYTFSLTVKLLHRYQQTKEKDLLPIAESELALYKEIGNILIAKAKTSNELDKNIKMLLLPDSVWQYEGNKKLLNSLMDAEKSVQEANNSEALLKIALARHTLLQDALPSYSMGKDVSLSELCQHSLDVLSRLIELEICSSKADWSQSSVKQQTAVCSKLLQDWEEYRKQNPTCEDSLYR